MCVSLCLLARRIGSRFLKPFPVDLTCLYGPPRRTRDCLLVARSQKCKTLVSSCSDDLSAHSRPRPLPTRRAQHQLFQANQPRAPAHAFPAALPWHLPTGIRAARSPRTSPTARAMGRQRARPSPCPATQGTAPPTSAPTRAPIPRACTAGATPCKAVSRLSSPNHQTFAFPPSQKRASNKGKPPPAQVKLAFNPT